MAIQPNEDRSLGPLEEDEARHPVEELARKKLDELGLCLFTKSESAIVQLLLCLEDEIALTAPHGKPKMLDFLEVHMEMNPSAFVELLQRVLNRYNDSPSYLDEVSDGSPLEVANDLEVAVHWALCILDPTYPDGVIDGDAYREF